MHAYRTVMKKNHRLYLDTYYEHSSIWNVCSTQRVSVHVPAASNLSLLSQFVCRAARTQKQLINASQRPVTFALFIFQVFIYPRMFPKFIQFSVILRIWSWKLIAKKVSMNYRRTWNMPTANENKYVLVHIIHQLRIPNECNNNDHTSQKRDLADNIWCVDIPIQNGILCVRQYSAIREYHFYYICSINTWGIVLSPEIFPVFDLK